MSWEWLARWLDENPDRGALACTVVVLAVCMTVSVVAMAVAGSERKATTMSGDKMVANG